MGYSISTGDRISISYENMDVAADILRRHLKECGARYASHDTPNPRAMNFLELMWELTGFGVVGGGYPGDRNYGLIIHNFGPGIFHFQWELEKAVEAEVPLAKIADLLEPCTVHWVGEDGAQWRWVISADGLEVQEPKIVWPGDES